MLNLWRPYQVTAEIWRASQPPTALARRATNTATSPPWPVVAWWGLYLLPVLIGAVAWITLGAPRHFDRLRAHLLVSMAQSLLTIPGAAATIELVRRLNLRQSDLQDRLPTRHRPPRRDDPYRAS